MASGWFNDPYGRHEARWMSSGRPTALVRDGTMEGSDPPPENPPAPTTVPAVPVTPTAVPAAPVTDTATGGPGLQRPDPHPVPGAPRDHRTADAGRRRVRGALLLFGGLAALIGAYFLYQQGYTPPTHRFVPSSSQLHVLQTGGTATPTACSDSAQNAAANGASELDIDPDAADTQFTVYPQTVIVLLGGRRQTPELSTSAPVCALDVGGGGAPAYYMEKPGRFTAYFFSGDEVSVVRVVVSSSGQPAPLTIGLVLLVLGGLACVVGVVLLWPRRRDHVVDTLRRADDAARGPGYDPRTGQRAAWDIVVDQQSGQF